MAAFTDQFETRDPLTPPSPALLAQIPVGRIIGGCQRMLADRGLDELVAIARAIDARIDLEAARVGAHFRKQMAATLVPARTADKITQSAYLRRSNDDLVLLDASGTPTSARGVSGPKFQVAPWQAWAVFALWKAFDYLDAVDEPAAADGLDAPAGTFSWVNAEQVQAYSRRAAKAVVARHTLGALAAEAAAGYERARAELRVHELVTQVKANVSRKAADFLDAVQTQQQAKVRKNARDAARKKNAVFDNEGERAARVIRDAEVRSGKKFATWEGAVSHLADGADFKNPRSGLPYSDRGTLRRYLKEGGWTPTKRSRPAS